MAKKIKRQQGNLGAVQKLTVQVQKSTTKIAYCFLKMVDKSKNSRLTSPRRVVYNRFEVPIRCEASCRTGSRIGMDRLQAGKSCRLQLLAEWINPDNQAGLYVTQVILHNTINTVK